MAFAAKTGDHLPGGRRMDEAEKRFIPPPRESFESGSRALR